MGFAERVAEETPYNSVWSAVSSAWGVDSRDTCAVSRALANMRGSTVRGSGSGMNEWDWIAQSMMVQNLVRRELSGIWLLMLDAYFTLPVSSAGREVKEGCCRRIVVELRREGDLRGPIQYLVDICRGWSNNGRRHHDEKWWSEHLKVSPKTLQRWRNGGNGTKGAGITKVLDGYLDGALHRLDDPMVAAGLIPG